MPSEKSLIGSYGTWAASLLPKTPLLSFRNTDRNNLPEWQREALAKTSELIASPTRVAAPKVKIEKKYVYDGLEIEELSWELPYGRATKAVLLKPQGATKPLPAILGLHDHAGKKYFGYRKIVKTSDDQHPLLKEHQATDYEGRAWANEIAKQGYVVLVHDAFAFGSRRAYYEDTKGLEWGALNTAGKSDENPEKSENIEIYNTWSSEHEHVMSKSLFSAGTTWPGVFLSEDQYALDILSSRNDVDPNRIGCGGLSGGGLRTVYLAGLDKRIKCAVCVGFMTTWADFVLNKSFTHTWMTYTPLLPKYLEFPEILGLRVPLPTLVLNNNQDELYTLAEMKKADAILGDVYKKANASEKYKANFYDGPHKFDLQMQKDAFAWFDKWL
ncbi:alpha/beta hydrolase family protein [Dyadobacter sp. CY323]|uniref:alpha/beta hydrolase family protein n=1 Tax=Dyadobacter sp. CY323 TaxID=2907302 RepID=UPI001F26E916|nr:alpha/beta hydrolase family protein [Dyadobacter sp. CY323]MCE6992325.1 alpha/beta hydrolase family protein [Dyadobacter sp. CY323]